MILITGAGGKTGRVLIKTLSKEKRVCAFVHREEQATVVQSLGAERVVVGDLHDKTAIRLAMEGVRAVYLMCPNMSPDEVVIGDLMIREAKKAGVGQIVYHSVLHPQTKKMAHHWQKLRVEEMLFESGLPFTILQPAPYMQNLLAVWKSIVTEGILRVPYSIHSKFSFVDLDDIAEAGNIVLTEPGHLFSTYELAGTPPTSIADVAMKCGRILNHEVFADKEELRDWRSRASGMSEYAAENLAGMFEYYDRWGLSGNPNVLKWIIKRPPTLLEDFVRRTVMEQDRAQ